MGWIPVFVRGLCAGMAEFFSGIGVNGSINSRVRGNDAVYEQVMAKVARKCVRETCRIMQQLTRFMGRIIRLLSRFYYLAAVLWRAIVHLFPGKQADDNAGGKGKQIGHMFF